MKTRTGGHSVQFTDVETLKKAIENGGVDQMQASGAAAQDKRKG